eukprot:31022-Pelagococcus_subviridis.AAC.6
MFFTHLSVSIFDRVPFQLTDEHVRLVTLTRPAPAPVPTAAVVSVNDDDLSVCPFIPAARAPSESPPLGRDGDETQPRPSHGRRTTEVRRRRARRHQRDDRPRDAAQAHAVHGVRPPPRSPARTDRFRSSPNEDLFRLDASLTIPPSLPPFLRRRREEGFPQTASVVKNRLIALGAKKPDAVVDSETEADAASFAEDLVRWTNDLKAADVADAAEPTFVRARDRDGDGVAPIRCIPTTTVNPTGADEAAKKRAKDDAEKSDDGEGRTRSIFTLDFARRISPPTPRFQYPASTPFNAASDAIQLHPDVGSRRTSGSRGALRSGVDAVRRVRSDPG